jgi:hypothetical protein
MIQVVWEFVVKHLTIDSWESRRHREDMLTRAEGEYARLDSSFADCMDPEAQVGIFEVRQGPGE